MTITVSAVNDNPVAVDDDAATAEDTLVAADVITNDTDLDNTNAQLLVVEASISATNGTATLGADGRTIRFTPAANKNDGNVGPAGFTVTYRATDGDLVSNEATLTITVSAVNDNPVVTLSASNDLTVSEGTQHTYAFSVSDVDSNSFTVVAVSCGANGSQVGATSTTASGGSFDCRFPDGPASSAVSVQVTDSDNANSNTATQTVTVNNVAPVVNTVTMSSIDSVSGIATLTATFGDPGADTFSGSGFTVTYSGGSATVTNVQVTERTMTAKVQLPRGCYTYIVTATVTDDDAGTNTKSSTYSSTDIYRAAFKDPIRDNERNIAKYGNVVPVKVQLSSSCSGAAITNADLYLTIVEGNVTNDAIDDTPNLVVASVSTADTGNQMRTSGDMYIYNLSTKSLKQGQDYTLRIRSGSSMGLVILKALLQPKK